MGEAGACPGLPPSPTPVGALAVHSTVASLKQVFEAMMFASTVKYWEAAPFARR